VSASPFQDNELGPITNEDDVGCKAPRFRSVIVQRLPPTPYSATFSAE
jgi:hypothetical protein